MDYAAILQSAPLAAYMPEATLRRLVDEAEPLYLRGGEYLYREGEASDHFYVVAAGRLRVASGRDTLVGHIGFGEPVGEAGVISGEVRSASVRALRDSIVLRLGREPFLQFLNAHAPAAVALTRRLIFRLRQTPRERQRAATLGQSAIAIFPASAGVPAMALAEVLARAFGHYPAVRVISAAHVDASIGSGSAQAPYADAGLSRRLQEWFCDLERRHPHALAAAAGARLAHEGAGADRLGRGRVHRRVAAAQPDPHARPVGAGVRTGGLAPRKQSRCDEPEREHQCLVEPALRLGLAGRDCERVVAEARDQRRTDGRGRDGRRRSEAAA